MSLDNISLWQEFFYYYFSPFIFLNQAFEFCKSFEEERVTTALGFPAPVEHGKINLGIKLQLLPCCKPAKQ